MLIGKRLQHGYWIILFGMFLLLAGEQGLTLVADDQFAFGGTAADVPLRDPSVTNVFPKDEPLITSMYKGWNVKEAIVWLNRIGANHVWLSDEATPEDARLFLKAGFVPVKLTHPAKRTGEPRSKEEWVYFYLKTPWYQKRAGPLRIELLQDFARDLFVVADHIEPAIALRVQEKSTRQALSAADYEPAMKEGYVTINGGKVGESYRVVFLASYQPQGGPGKQAVFSDGTVESAKQRHLEQIRQILKEFDAATVIRPTSLIYHFLQIFDSHSDNPVADKVTRYYTWWGYWLGMSPERLERYKQRYGQPFDPLWMANTNFGEEGFLPPAGYRQWIDLIREDIHAYARAYNRVVHDAGRRVRFFFGDDWKGIEPWLGDLDTTRYDEVVTSMNRGPLSVRFITGFPGNARRIVRFPWLRTLPNERSQRPNQAITQIQRNWRWMKRELLFKCADGLTFGGDEVAEATNGQIGDELVRVTRDFRQMFKLIFNRQVYTHDINVYVLNAWGKMRSWINTTHYESQKQVYPQMVDWPVNIQWISFDEVIEKGLPKDATVVMLTGEPNTAWGGGSYWKHSKLVEAIQSLVRNGGGLLVIGGPTYSDGHFALDNVLGVQYAGPSNEAAAEELWNINRWSDSGRSARTYSFLGGPLPHADLVIDSTTLPSELASRIEKSSITTLYDSKVRSVGARAIARSKDNDTGVFLHEFGRGRIAYIGGYGDYGRLFKVLLFYVAKRLDALDKLDADAVTIATYFYPENKLLIVFNYGAQRVKTKVRFDPMLTNLKNVKRIKLESIEGAAETITLSVQELTTGFSVTLEPSQTIYWRISPATSP